MGFAVDKIVRQNMIQFPSYLSYGLHCLLGTFHNLLVIFQRKSLPDPMDSIKRDVLVK